MLKRRDIFIYMLYLGLGKVAGFAYVASSIHHKSFWKQHAKPATFAEDKGPDRNTGNSVPNSLRKVCELFDVAQLFANTEGCETGPSAYSPYPSWESSHLRMKLQR